jgi:DNA-binding NarL/FixJ family response regulator
VSRAEVSPDVKFDGVVLARLRTIVRDLQAANAHGTSLHEVVKLARQVELDTGVTVDFEATRELGQPLVVVRMPSEPSRPDGLTTREREVAELIAEGLSNKEIARRLHLTLGTVKYYVHHILDKMGLQSRVGIATRLNRR